MFTGIVEETGEVISLERHATGGRLVVRARTILEDIRIGDSIAVNGCCLTATSAQDGLLTFDLLGETLTRTSLNDLAPSVPVNLERALRADGRLGGHFVQGHIDGTVEILRLERVNHDHKLVLELPRQYARYVSHKGSVCLDGISLTVAEVGNESFTIWLIPHTMAVTNMRTRRAGDRINVEYDLLAKYLERMVSVK